MKSLVLCVLILAILIAATIICSILITSMLNEMKSILSDFSNEPIERTEQAKELRSIWKKNKIALTVSLDHEKLLNSELAINDFVNAVESNASYDIEGKKQNLALVLEQLIEEQSLSTHAIL